MARKMLKTVRTSYFDAVLAQCGVAEVDTFVGGNLGPVAVDRTLVTAGGAGQHSDPSLPETRAISRRLQITTLFPTGHVLTDVSVTYVSLPPIGFYYH